MEMKMEHAIISDLLKESVEYKEQIVRLKDALHAAVNELCYQCGRSKDEHLGACDRCKWRSIRNGEMP